MTESIYGFALGAGIAIPLAFVNQLLSDAIYVVVALSWLVPDRRIEKLFDEISIEKEGES